VKILSCSFADLRLPRGVDASQLHIGDLPFSNAAVQEVDVVVALGECRAMIFKDRTHDTPRIIPLVEFKDLYL